MAPVSGTPWSSTSAAGVVLPRRKHDALVKSTVIAADVYWPGSTRLRSTSCETFVIVARSTTMGVLMSVLTAPAALVIEIEVTSRLNDVTSSSGASASATESAADGLELELPPQRAARRRAAKQAARCIGVRCIGVRYIGKS